MRPGNRRKPAKTNEFSSDPQHEKAEIAALAPGTGTTGMFSSSAALTRNFPGSLTAGVPASLMRAMFLPLLSSSICCSRNFFSVNLWYEKIGFFMPKRLSKFPETRLSSASTMSQLSSTETALEVMSPMFPIGVAVTKRVPAMLVPRCVKSRFNIVDIKTAVFLFY